MNRERVCMNWSQLESACAEADNPNFKQTEYGKIRIQAWQNYYSDFAAKKPEIWEGLCNGFLDMIEASCSGLNDNGAQIVLDYMLKTNKDFSMTFVLNECRLFTNDFLKPFWNQLKGIE